jgi:hypothetical protein
VASKNGKKETKTNVPPFRFINYSLSTKDLDKLRSLDMETEFPYRVIDELVMEGYKFSLSYDDKNACCVASITDRQPASSFYNACLSGRGSTPANAFAALLYRHLVLAETDWSFFGESDTTGSSDFG